MNRWTRRLLQGLSLIALGTVGCAQEREPINRVQPQALEKSFFVGKLADNCDNPTFYSKAFVIDQSAGQNGLSVGLYSGTDKIRFEITEDYLIARKGYQIVQNQDPHGVPGSCEINGTIVAKYKISSHFDIKRSYNPQTGENLNIVEENTTDRPWNQRQYMRVDWSTNEVNDPMWGEMFLGKVFGDMSIEPLTYTVTDPKSEDAPYFDSKDGYFDVTNKYYVTPEETYVPDWGQSVPTCALVGIYTSTTSNDCNPQEATVRLSFWKMKADHDFEPMENTLRKYDIVANFGGAGDSLQPGFAGGTTQCWDPQYAYTEACFHQYMNKHNFWAKSHTDVACTSNDDGDHNGTADQCAAAAQIGGSQCDLYNKKCTIPLRARTIKSTGWWLNKETPDELLDPVDAPVTGHGEHATGGNPTGAMDPVQGVPVFRGALEDVVKSWNQIMTASLAYGREAECRSTGTADRDTCHRTYFQVGADGKDVTQMLAFGAWGIPTPIVQQGDDVAAMVTCHAPVRPYDNHTVCGEYGEIARNGDQRKNFLYYWPYDSDAHYGGVAGLGQDPETGESHGGTATIMGRSATGAAARYRDFIQVAMGDFSVDDITTGVPQWVFNKIQQNGYSPESDMGRKARGEKIEYGKPSGSSGTSAKQGQQPANGTLTKNGSGTIQPSAAQLSQSMRTRLEAQRNSAIDPRVQDMTQPLWESYASKLRGTDVEAQLVDPGWAMATMGADPSKPVDGSMLEAASPLRGLDNGRLELWRARMAGRLANRGVCFMDNDVPRIGSVNFIGMTRYYLDKFHELGLDTDIVAGGARDAALVKQRGEYIYKDLFHGMATGIAIHEVGHVLGMRHNFASSYDAQNFMPQYWQLRTNMSPMSQTDGPTAPCAGPRDPNSPDTCMGVRFNDPETEDESGFQVGNGRPAVDYFGNSTVMEYEQDYMSPGIAPYDFMFMKAVYGGVLETYDIDHVDQGGVAEDQQKAFLLNFGLERSETNTLDDGYAHYTELARTGKVFDPSYCRDATPEELQQGSWRVIHGKICTQSPRDHAFWKDFLNDDEGGYTPETIAAGWGWAFTSWHTNPQQVGQQGHSRVRWNYRYGETYGSGYYHTNYSDNGADVYEITTNNSKMFDLTYPLTYFRRSNKEFYYGPGNGGDAVIPLQTSNRYFERARSFHWLLDGTPNMGKPELNEAYSRAEHESFYLLARAALTPEPGPMKHFQSYWDVDSNGSITAPASFQVALVDGRYVADEFDDFKGGQWDYLSWIKRVGFNEERGLAMRALLDGRPTLYTISRDTWLDGRNVMKNYRTDLASGVDRLVGGILSADWDTTGMWVKDDIPAGADQLPFRSPQMLNLLDGAPARPAGADVVFPNIGYKTQLWAMVWGHLFSRMNSDMTFVNKMKIWLEGIDFIGAIPENELVKFTDPVSGYTYVARLYGNDTINGKTVDKGIASRMLQHANDLLTLNAPDSEVVRNYVGLLDVTRKVGRKFDGPDVQGY